MYERIPVQLNFGGKVVKNVTHVRDSPFLMLHVCRMKCYNILLDIIYENKKHLEYIILLSILKWFYQL